MIKAFSAIAIAAFVAAALTVLPGFAPQVEASVPAPLAKADRLDVRSGGCAQQAWPNIEASCLRVPGSRTLRQEDRKSTRLNSSHANISYAVFCLKKKKQNTKTHTT